MKTSTRQAPRVPAGENSLAALAEVYSKQSDLEDIFDGLTQSAELHDAKSFIVEASRASWDSRMRNACVIMGQAPQSTADLLITIGLASRYIDVVFGNSDGREGAILGGVQSALDNAFKYLIAEGAVHGMPASLSPLIEEFCRDTGAPERGPAPQAEAA